MRRLPVLWAACSLVLTLAAPSASQAHHAFAAEFDSEKPVKVQGFVTKLQLVNPHSWIYLDVKNPDGSSTNWGFEFGTPNTLGVKGITRDTIRAGATVEIEGYRAKNGGPFGYCHSVTLADGRKVRIGTANDAPTAP